jgi:hypothetical protein
VNEASLSNTTFRLRDPKGVVSGMVSSAGTTATFTPTRNLSLATPYTATVSVDVTDTAGLPLGADYSWNFTTRDGVWGSAQLAETDNAGNALAVWSQSDGTRQNSYNILANRFTPATGWGTAQLIETDNTREAVSPHVAVDSSGNALAVWSQFDGTRYSILANRLE